jgi:hypothetical protein
MPKTLRLLAVLALAAVAFAETAPAPVEPPAPADLAERAHLSDELFPVKPASDAAYAGTLKSARAAGTSEERLLESEVYRALMHRVKSSDALALATRLDAAAPSWHADTAVIIDSPALARSLVHALRALHAARSGDEALYRSEAAEAVFGSVKLADLLADIGAERRREALVGHPDFAAFSRACAEDNEPAVRRFFARAYWADAPVSCDLAIAKLTLFRADRAEAVSVVPTQKPDRGVAAFTPLRRDRAGLPLRTEVLR